MAQAAFTPTSSDQWGSDDDIGAIAGVTNLGPVSGDLSGSVAATILGQNSNGTYTCNTIGLPPRVRLFHSKRQCYALPTRSQAFTPGIWGATSKVRPTAFAGGTGKFEGELE